MRTELVTLGETMALLSGVAVGTRGAIIGLTTGQSLAFRDHIVGGELVETQTECIDLDGSETLIWEAIATAVRVYPTRLASQTQMAR